MAKQASLEKDKGTVQAMITMGCDREMAAKGVGWSVTKLRRVMHDDPEFSQEVLRAEGQAEFQRMRLLHNATKDDKNWRAATWWLERRAKNRYARRTARPVTTAEIQEFIDHLVDIVFAEITREADRDRLVASLLTLARDWESEGEYPEVANDSAEEDPA